LNDLATPSAYGTLTEPTTVKIQRLLPGPIERVWSYLTQSELRRQWLAAGTMENAAGTDVEFVWRNEELSDPPSQRPEGFPEEHRMTSQIVEFDPPHKLVITWQGSGNVAFDLKRQGDDVLLTLLHERLPNRKTLLMVSAGWHMHLDLLVASMTGAQRLDFWEGWGRLHKEYDELLPL